jgi:hypothetical protein
MRNVASPKIASLHTDRHVAALVEVTPFTTISMRRAPFSYKLVLPILHLCLLH